MDDPLHLEKFNHSCSRDLQVDPSALSKMRSQEFDYFLVLDLEGKVEILEFPVVMIDAKTMEVVDFFHRLTLSSLIIKHVAASNPLVFYLHLHLHF